MQTIDAHQHFWHYHPNTHSWITDDMDVIRKDFLPSDLMPLLAENNIDGTVAVQADQSEKETGFLLLAAEENNFIKAVVGWTDLCAENILERLEYYKSFKKLKGFRHILQAEQPSFMLQSKFLRGISLLKDFDFTYDILIYPEHLSAALQLVNLFPEQMFVIDHLAKPLIKKQEINEWANGMKLLSAHKNVYCKISGMVTEADVKNWKQEDFIPYLDVVTNAFGTDRLMYGSDWPVCLVAASYSKCIGIVKKYFQSFSETEQQKIFGLNATSFYKI
ncbi:amidohydrolase [mine drainage metagenome]|uniref:Amidohydrolase n=1 Tax=mine drainage metagenome TaxID=410659 RepID=A0A1J5TAE3_9ZZZZ